MDKEKIKEGFSKVALTYDSYAQVQREAGQILIEKIKNKKFYNILEIGCGTGIYTLLLSEYFPDAKIFAIDFSPKMLQVASKKIKSKNIKFLLLDGENIGEFLHKSFDSASTKAGFDLITSNSVFQWFFDFDWKTII